MKSSPIGIVLGLMGTLGACGSSGGSTSPISIDDLPQQVIAADCELFVRCNLASDQTSCTTLLGQALQQEGFGSLGAITAGVKMAKINYNASAARACLNELRDTPCADVFGPGPIGGRVCEAVFSGTVANGGRCIANEECLPSNFCASPDDSVTGNQSCDGICTAGGSLCNDASDCAGGQVCDTSMGTVTSDGTCVTPTPAGAVGRPCGTNQKCQPGLFCSASICTAPAAEGQPCLGFGCADGLICAPSDSLTSAICMVPAKKGQACQARAQCGGPFSLLTCDQTSHLCVDAPTTGPCASTQDCNSLSSYCNTQLATPLCEPHTPIASACRIGSGECGSFSVNTCQPETPGSQTGLCGRPPACIP